jgi:hypothetical protein
MSGAASPTSGASDNRIRNKYFQDSLPVSDPCVSSCDAKKPALVCYSFAGYTQEETRVEGGFSFETPTWEEISEKLYRTEAYASLLQEINPDGIKIKKNPIGFLGSSTEVYVNYIPAIKAELQAKPAIAVAAIPETVETVDAVDVRAENAVEVNNALKPDVVEAPEPDVVETAVDDAAEPDVSISYSRLDVFIDPAEDDNCVKGAVCSVKTIIEDMEGDDGTITDINIQNPIILVSKQIYNLTNGTSGKVLNLNLKIPDRISGQMDPSGRNIYFVIIQTSGRDIYRRIEIKEKPAPVAEPAPAPVAAPAQRQIHVDESRRKAVEKPARKPKTTPAPVAEPDPAPRPKKKKTVEQLYRELF